MSRPELNLEETALHSEAIGLYTEAIKLLIAKAEVTLTNETGETVCSWRQESDDVTSLGYYHQGTQMHLGSRKIVNISPSAVGKREQSASRNVTRCPNRDLVEVRNSTGRGDTFALYYVRGHDQVVAVLLRANADVLIATGIKRLLCI